MKWTIVEEHVDGKAIKMVRIDNNQGMVLTISSLGASIYSLLLRGNQSDYEEVTLNHRTV